MSFDIEEQYDKIYKYCYFKLNNRESAEDVTQETFLRYLERYEHTNPVSALKYLYTIARNLCVDEYRKPQTTPIDESILDSPMEDALLTNFSVKVALSAASRFREELRKEDLYERLEE